MTPESSPFAPATLQSVIQRTLEQSDLPARHGVALVVDLKTGARIAVATRFGDSPWQVNINAGYSWSGEPDAKITIGRSFR